MNVVYLSLNPGTPASGYWDHGIIQDLLSGFPVKESLEGLDEAIIVFPARAQIHLVKEINNILSKLKRVVLILSGDEESTFPVEQIEHPNIRIWVQNPKMGRHDKYHKLGTGYPPQIHENKVFSTKDLDYFFAGQITHERRLQMHNVIQNMAYGFYLPTDGFTKGIPHTEYYDAMSRSKIVPCPSGPVTVDSFRLFESLELGCVPIADTQTPNDDMKGFWEWLFEEPVPFPTIENWESLPGYVYDVSVKYPSYNNSVQSWWMRYKNKIKCALHEDLVAIGAEIVTNPITVVIPVSPIPSHPDTKIVDETIASIKHHLPEAQIIVTFDGVRKEQEHMRANYEEHIRKVLWENPEIIPYVFQEHQHQVGMMKAIIDHIKTPLLLYVEQDAPLVIDEVIEWEKIQNKILSGESNMVRFHFEAYIPAEHRHMMLDKDPKDGFMRTAQWSSRPHLASTAFYRKMMRDNFTPGAKSFIEDLIHGKLHQAYVLDGEQGWNQWRVHIYHPEGHIKRSYTTDGRAGAPKYDDSQIW